MGRRFAWPLRKGGVAINKLDEAVLTQQQTWSLSESVQDNVMMEVNMSICKK
jgi:hypothetical protein